MTKKREKSAEKYSDKRKLPPSGSKTVPATLNEHTGRRDGEHTNTKKIRIIYPPLISIQMQLRHVTEERNRAITF